MITGKNIVAGKFSNTGANTFKTFNPELNLDNEWDFYEATADEVSSAMQEAVEAFELFTVCPDDIRAKFLRAIAQQIEALGDELLNVYKMESGLPLNRARAERSRTLHQLNMFADFISKNDWRGTFVEEAEPNRLPKPKPSLYKTHIPIGPVAVFGASNFPLAYSTAGGDTASAFAAGCPVIVKSHPMHAGTGELVASAIVRAIEDVDLPPGIFSNLNSGGIDVGKQIVQHPKLKAVGFTGSIKGGRALYDLAASREEPIPVFAEMGSVNPVVISSNALKTDLKKWVEMYAESITNGTGQFCTKPGLLFGIDSSELDEFAVQLSQKIALKDSTVMLNPSIENNYESNRQLAIEQNNVAVLTEAHDVKPNYGKQTIATVDGTTFFSNPTLHHEVFGPYAIIIKCKNLQQIQEIIEHIEGQLTGTVIVEKEDFEDFKPIVKALSQRVGRLIYNGVPTGVEVTEAMTHGGPYPASTDSRFTAVGVHSIKRWIRPVTFQNFPKELRPV